MLLFDALVFKLFSFLNFILVIEMVVKAHENVETPK